MNCYAFNVAADYSEVIFNTNVAGTLNILRTVPIRMDDDSYGNIHVPEPYNHFIITKLAESLAVRFKFMENASVFAQKSARMGEVLANNNTSRRPIKQNLLVGLSKFRKYA